MQTFRYHFVVHVLYTNRSLLVRVIVRALKKELQSESQCIEGQQHGLADAGGIVMILIE